MNNSAEAVMQPGQPELFSTAPSPILPIWDKTGKVNAQQLAKFLEFSKKEVASAARVGEHSFAYNQRLPKVVEERLLEWAAVMEMVAAFFNGNTVKTSLWFKLPNPLLGGIRPRDMIRVGRTDKLTRIVKDALDGIWP
jgi:hypothetical protein